MRLTDTIEDALAGRGLPTLPVPLAAETIDSHTHLDTVREFTTLVAAQSLAAAAKVGVTRIVQIGCDVDGSRFAERLARGRTGVVAAVAIHPNDAVRIARRSRQDLAEALRVVDELAGAGPHVRAIGETGIDHHETPEGPDWDLQREVFAAHIRMAHEHGLTLAIHDRDGHDDVLAVLDEVGWPDRVIMHCFSGDEDLARTCVEHGAWLSFPGVLTFRNADNLRRALAVTPRERILVETDAPFLTPTPCRGKRNGPYLLPHTVRFLADQLGWDERECCEQLRLNTFEAYGGPWPAHGEDDDV
ncbi:TatD family hydrolase [Acidipropionibacterium timonense]|uniref:TatD family hydrolase n=1 Tax=Acidipropionibacterium timonense TaxID=2161818 RepID=UPI00102FFA19|nr:TatD family hydrolase [Acidipropionibacterium timonense]